MKIRVKIYNDFFDCGAIPDHEYVMDHNDPAQRRVLGEQCRNAFEAGQVVMTGPEEILK